MFNIYDICFPLVNKQNHYVGSSFKWDERFYATCKHVLKDKNEISIIFEVEGYQSSHTITKTYFSEKYDLCLFEIEQERALPPHLNKTMDELFMGQEVILLGRTSHIPGVIEPRYIKTYIHRAMAKPEDWFIDNFGLITVNELNVQIPKGFSGGPVISPNNILLGMALGTNAIENNCYTVEEEIITSAQERSSVQIKEITYLGLIHSVKDINKIISSIDFNIYP